MSLYFNCCGCGRKVHFNQINPSQNQRLLQSKRPCKGLLISLQKSEFFTFLEIRKVDDRKIGFN